jgi:hypothetical protein
VKRKAKFHVGQRIIIPDVKGQRFAGMAMQQDPRNVDKTGTIIGFEDCGGIKCPRIRLDIPSRRIVMGYECWWMPLSDWKKAQCIKQPSGAMPARGRLPRRAQVTRLMIAVVMCALGLATFAEELKAPTWNGLECTGWAKPITKSLSDGDSEGDSLVVKTALTSQEKQTDDDFVPFGINRNMRVYLYRCGTGLGIAFAFIGFWNIYSSLLPPRRVPPQIKVIFGFNLVVLAWITLHASLDVLRFGGVYWSHLI